MKKFILPFVLLLVGLGLGFSIPHGAKQISKPVGGPAELDSHFVYGLWGGLSDQYFVDSSGNVYTSATSSASTTIATFTRTATVGSASTTSSTNPTVLLGAAAAGYITIGTSTPAGPNGQIVNASTTAIDAFSQVFLQQVATTTIVSTTCNSVPATSTIITNIFASTTNTSLNGFQAKAGSIPTTNPNCYYYRIIN